MSSTIQYHQSLGESIDLSDTNSSDWRYLAEGGATMVFSYTGPSHPVYSAMVLRARKRIFTSQYGLMQVHEDNNFLFHRTVIMRILDSEFLPVLLPAHASRDWLFQLTESAEKWRPEERRAVNGLDPTNCSLTLATDLVGRQGLVVEIKVGVIYI